MRVRVEWLTAGEREAVYAEALDILQRVGMRMKGPAVLPVLREAGAEVDDTGTVRLPAELVERAVALCPRELLMAGETPAEDVLLDGSRTFFNVSGCAAKTLDGQTGLVRPSTLGDLRDGTVVLEATPELDVVWTFLTATDVPLERRELVEYYTYLTETSRPVVFVDLPWEDRPRAAHLPDRPSGGPRAVSGEAAAVFALRGPLAPRGQRPNSSTWPASSPGLERRIGCLRCPSSGATAPVTPAGTLALMSAEVLGTLTAVPTAAPGAP